MEEKEEVLFCTFTPHAHSHQHTAQPSPAGHTVLLPQPHHAIDLNPCHCLIYTFHRLFPGPHTREELAENNRLATRRQIQTERGTTTGNETLAFLGDKVMLASQQDQLQKMLACLMNKIETPEPREKKYCSSH
ncbi:hypothetical protein E2C01_034293 [Portunus trituberculatus]|uniref:Uncharacterized protein n=1 Tax=Portunus trituberculatus TaxID=210409 RepID=A0A5B7F6L4_PORTR|nr:hypothetical protein [Portunus trituberculatus]